MNFGVISNRVVYQRLSSGPKLTELIINISQSGIFIRS